MDLHKQFLGIIDTKQFFNRDVQEVGKDLLGKIIQHNVDGIWISGIVLLRLQSSLSIFAPKLFINAKILILKDKICIMHLRIYEDTFEQRYLEMIAHLVKLK